MLLVIGIDLHGTLVDEQWEIKPTFLARLERALRAVREFSRLYICSGNDLQFLKKHIPTQILDLFFGHVLETGCVISDGEKEKIIIPGGQVNRIKELECLLKRIDYPQVKYFARRLATISLFTRTELDGEDPVSLYPEVCRRVKELGFGDSVMVTHSNVAVDIIPAGHNKFTGLRYVGRGYPLAGIADSFNDLHLVNQADLAFLPANASPRLLDAIRSQGKKVIPLSASHPPAPGLVFQNSGFFTEAVLQALEYLAGARPLLESAFSGLSRG